MTSTGATLLRLVAGAERVHRHREAVELARHAGKHIRRHPGRYGAAGLAAVWLLGGVLLFAVLAVFAVAGGLNGWERHRAERAAPNGKHAVNGKAGWLNSRRVWAGTALLDVLGVLGAVVWSARAVGLVAVAGIGVLVWARAPKSSDWWAHRKLVPALVQAGILRRPGIKEPAPKVLYKGRPTVDERGTAVTVTLPGVAAVEVEHKRVQLAAALGVPARLLVVRHDTDHAANVVTLWVGSPSSAGSAVSPLAVVERTDWSQPVRIGCDERGNPVTLATVEQNTLVAGVPGSTKTTQARKLVGHWVLDPATSLYGLDGKGSQDYRLAAPYFTRWVSGADENAPAELVAMLAEVLETVRARNNAGEVGPGLLLLLEELQDVRAAADRRTMAELDTLRGRIIRMGRAVGVHVLISTQRPSTDDVPSGVRNLVTQRLCLMVRNPADAALVLGTAPPLALPTRRGEGVLTTPASTRAVTLDLLDDAAFAAVCRRAGAMRQTHPAPAVCRQPFADAVAGLLRDGPLTATALYEWLPEELRQGSKVALGRAVGQLAGVERTRVGKSPAWQLTAARDTAVRGISHAQDGRGNPSLVAS
ncbi:MAG: hypothetical protein ACR2JO_02055 [Mycobacteriales bacterium]